MPTYFKNVVLADDDEEDIELYSAVMTALCTDVTISVARDGMILMQLLKDIPKPDLILLDINMPLKSGVDCLQEIRQMEVYNDVIIIVISTTDFNKDSYLQQGANYFVAKPCTYLEIHDFIKSICEGKMEDRA